MKDMLESESYVKDLHGENELLKLKLIKLKQELGPNNQNMLNFEKVAYRLLNQDLQVRLKFQNMMLDWNRFGDYIQSLENLDDNENEKEPPNIRDDFISS